MGKPRASRTAAGKKPRSAGSGRGKAPAKKSAPKKAAPARKTTSKKVPPEKSNKAPPEKAAAKKAASKPGPGRSRPPSKAPPAPTIEPHLWQPGPHAEEIGLLDVPSGKVMVCDAGTLWGPVAVELPPGRYHVRIARNEQGDNEAAILLAEGAAPVNWTEVGTYGVDAGMSAFFDAEVFARVDRHRFPISIYDDLISNHLDPAEAKGHAGAFVPFEEARFSACRSGYGDGVYPVFVGHGASGAVQAVVTIFM